VPPTRLAFYREEGGTFPFLEWFDSLPEKAQDKCFVRLERLRAMGHELRVGLHGVQYRMLYFFHRAEAVVVSHGMVKERVVPAREIDRAILRKTRFAAAPRKHTYEEG
jgi:hypothetical protein